MHDDSNGHEHAHGQAGEGSGLAVEHGAGHKHEHKHGHHVGHSHDHGPIDPDLAESRAGVRVLLISLLVLGATAVAQAVIVYLTSSVALFADTVHNVGDALTAVPLAIAFVLARRTPTRRFAWGLGRAEDLAGLMIVALIAFSGLVALVASIDRLVHPHRPDYLAAGIAAGFLGFVGNELVAVYRIRQGRRMHSAALIADGEHARVDGFTSLSVAAGLILVAVGVERADPVIGIAISLVIMRITWKTARQVGLRLLDGIEPEYLDPIRAVVELAVPAEALRDVRGRWFGHVIHVEVSVDPSALAPARLNELGRELAATLREAGTRARRVSVVLS